MKKALLSYVKSYLYVDGADEEGGEQLADTLYQVERHGELEPGVGLLLILMEGSEEPARGGEDLGGVEVEEGQG